MGTERIKSCFLPKASFYVKYFMFLLRSTNILLTADLGVGIHRNCRQI